MPLMLGSVASSAPTVDPLLAQFDVLYQAANFTGADGDDWPNEGTGGSAYDAQAADVGYDATVGGVPHFVTSPSPGFEIDAAVVAYYYVPQGASIEPGTGSFTVFDRFFWPAGSAGAFDNVSAKVVGALGGGGHGWQVASGTALGNNTFAIVANGGSDGTGATDPRFAVGSGNISQNAEHLVVMRVNRSNQHLDLFIDNMASAAGTNTDVSTVPDVTVAHEWIFGRGKTQTNRAYGLIKRSLTDVEVARLGVLFPIA